MILTIYWDPLLSDLEYTDKTLTKSSFLDVTALKASACHLSKAKAKCVCVCVCGLKVMCLIVTKTSSGKAAIKYL